MRGEFPVSSFLKPLRTGAAGFVLASLATFGDLTPYIPGYLEIKDLKGMSSPGLSIHFFEGWDGDCESI